MCVRVYACEQSVLPESLLNYLNHAFRILNASHCLFFMSSDFYPRYDYRCPACTLKATICFFLTVAQIPPNGTN